MQNPWEKLLTCDKCGEPMAIKKMKGRSTLVAVGRCPRGHRKAINLSVSNMNEWIFTIDSHLFKCIKCDMPSIVSPTIKGEWVKVSIRCPTHGKNDTRLFPLVVYNKIVEIRKKIESPSTPPSHPISTTPTTPPIVTPPTAPNCQYCGTPTQYISKYSRYYCYKCQRYVEDQQVIEKVRTPSEIKPEISEIVLEDTDIELKIKEFAGKAEKGEPVAICDIPFELNMPTLDTTKIEDMLQKMINEGELNGELDSVTGYVTFTKHRVPPKPAAEISVSTEDLAPTELVEAVRDFDYVGGQVRFKVAIRNKTKFVITNVGVELDIPKEFKLIRILPDSSLDDLKRGLAKIDKLMPNSSQGIDYFLEPVACGTGVITGLTKFIDAEGRYKSTELKPKEVAIKCPLVFTPEEANIAMVRNLTDTLEQDFRRWALPTNPQDSFLQLHETVSQFEIAHIQAFQISGTPYEVESWYYTRTKNTDHPITLRINVSEQRNAIDLIIACEDMAELTGLLAKIAEDFKMKLQSKYNMELKPAFSNLKQLLCECGSPLPKLPSITEEVVCNNCSKAYTWEMLG